MEKDFRLDTYIGQNYENISRSYAAQLIERGFVSVNDKTIINKSFKVKDSDDIVVDIPPATNLEIVAENIPLEIVYEDSDLIVVNKPQDMVVHPGNGNWTGTLVNAIMYYCGDTLSSINGIIRPGIVHRIDKDTSGLLMIAKNNKAHESLALQLQNHTVTRRYTALVYGNIKEENITINEPIGRDTKNRLRKAVNGASSKEAVTHIKVLERYRDYSLINAELETGRTHQIRVHMAYIKHPLVGDELYGPKNQIKKLFGIDLHGQMLHAGVLGFKHPTSHKYMEFKSELPEYYKKILEKLNTKKMCQ